MDYQYLANQFETRFKLKPRIFRSPGRINILGEHVDYNDGFVLPAGIDLEIVMLCSKSDEPTSTLLSVDEQEEVNFRHDEYKNIKTHWARYILGCLDQLVQRGHKIEPFNCLVTGNVPVGAGLSSSAALECAALFALCEMNNIKLERKEIALFAQKAENEFVGVNCGIMDQFASVFAKKDHVIKLDCRSLEFDYHSLDEKTHQFILVDSMVKHSLGNSEYNTRRKECELGVRALQDSGFPVESLRDADIHMLATLSGELSTEVIDRCAYIIQEIKRAEMASKAMDRDDFKRLGELMYETHAGLQHRYEVSCVELDFLVDFTRKRKEVAGARMMGGGFGGCTINLVNKSSSEQFCKDISEAYEAKYNTTPNIYRVMTSDGTSEVVL